MHVTHGTHRARWLFGIALPCALVAVNALRASADELAPFRRPALLERFDRDGDGRFDERERQALRDAFGGIDVPVLPARLPDYGRVELPEHVEAERLAAADNTPDDNPTTAAGALLGRVLFYDTILSANNTVACASCHLQRAGFADPRRLSVGYRGGHTSRNAMGLANLRYSNVLRHRPGFFWDERAESLEAQALMPIQDKVEMGMTLEQVESRLDGLPYYPPLFQAAFGSRRVTSQRVAQAIAQFVRSLVSFDSQFDRAAAGHRNYSAPFEDFSEAENRGKALFIDGVDGIAEHGCAHCHVPPTFGMPKALNNGLDLKYVDRGLGARDLPPNDPFTPSNDGKFKAPSLRNVALSAPYMHDGRFKTLEEVVRHYSQGIQPHANLGVAFERQEDQRGPAGFAYTAEQQAALVAFLKTLTDETFVTDEKFSDPFIRLPAE